MVLLLFREAYYKPENLEIENEADVNVAKNRNGPTGSVELMFVSNQLRFESMTRM